MKEGMNAWVCTGPQFPRGLPCFHYFQVPRTHRAETHPAKAPKGRGQTHSEKEDMAPSGSSEKPTWSHGLTSGTGAMRFGGESWGGCTPSLGHTPGLSFSGYLWGKATLSLITQMDSRAGLVMPCVADFPLLCSE